MTRKKSRPTHRENTAKVPSNEGGFYKMFWNSMDNPGANGPPSQGHMPVSSPPVIIIDDSPAGSPCAPHENTCENLVVPLPIKEEVHEDTVENSNQNAKYFQESHSGLNGYFSSHQTCLPGNLLTSASKNSLPSPSPSSHTDLVSLGNPNRTVDAGASEKTSSSVPSTDICVSSKQPPTVEEDSHLIKLAEEIQVCDKRTVEEHIEMFPESNASQLVNGNDGSEEMPFNNDVISSHSRILFENSGDTPTPPGVSLASPTSETILSETPARSREIPDEPAVSTSDFQSIAGITARASYISHELPTLTSQDISEETPGDFPSEPQPAACSEVNNEETPHEPRGEDIFDTRFVSNEELPADEVQNPPSPALSVNMGRTLSLLQSLLNARDEDLEVFNEAFSELPALIGQHDDLPGPDRQNEEEIGEFEPAQQTSFHNSVDVSNMDIDSSTTTLEHVLSVDENVGDVSQQNQTNEMILVEEDDEFPTFSNFLPRKIKLDSIGVLRSVKFLKDSVRALYKEYLKDDVILRTVNIPEPPVEQDNEPSDEVEETPTFPPVKVYPICCVKMERLPDPFVKKSTVAMSDDTFKTWKRQIIRQRNEEKFRHLKVWRRGRTLLWRECELAGMDRLTYDEQVAYVKKHKLNENSSCDSDSAGDESGNDASSSHQCDSSESDYSDLENEDSELSSDGFPSPSKQNSSKNQSVTSPHAQSENSAHIPSPGEEYVVERTSKDQSSETKISSALKITIRKASMSKSEDDSEKPTDEEDTFSVPAQPTIHKPRRIATKRTFRRPSDPVPKTAAPPKSAVADAKKPKSTVADEDLYDQSLLGTRSYEVENFNLLEKWEIPFEEPTLFRSPRAASRLAQLRTKEAFAPILKRHTAPKITTTATTTTTAAVTTNTVIKEVKDVVEMLCSKTVEAMLFPEYQSAGPKKPTKTDVVNSADAKDSRAQPNEVPSKSSVPCEEAILDESSEMSHSETNSTLDASSDFGGSTGSLVSEDFVPPKSKSPPKSRRRRRFCGPAWSKKKKAKGKASDEQQVVKESSERGEQSVKDISNSPSHATQQPVAEKYKLIERVGTSPAHSTQVPLVSEGPGQSPRESEDDSAHRTKERVSQNESNQTLKKSSGINQPGNVIKWSETPLEEPQPHKVVQEEIMIPRLTRSKQPKVELDPELLENFGTRKRKPRTGLLDVASHDDETSKKPKQEDTKKTPQKGRARSMNPSIKAEEPGPVTSKFVSDDSNTQVPEVSEGPGEVGSDREDKQDHENKLETWEPPLRMLRSRSQGPDPRSTKSTAPTVKESSADNKKSDEEDILADENQLEVPVVLESPQSPPPETVEEETLINSRITRSKKRRSGPAYVAVKSTVASALPSVCDVVDSIAGQRLPTLSKLFDASAATSSPAAEPVTSFRVETSTNLDDTPLINGKIPTSSSVEHGQQAQVLQSENVDGKLVQPPTTPGVTCLDGVPNQSTTPMASDGSSPETVPKSVTGVFDVAGQASELSKNSIGVDIPCLPTERNQSAAAVDCGLDVVAVEGGVSLAAATASETLGKPVTENVGSGRLKVLDTLNCILAVTSPKKVRRPVSATSPLLPPLLSSTNQITPPNKSISQPSVSNVLTPPAVSSTSLPTFLTSTPDMNSILPGTFLNSLISSTIDASLTTYSNQMNDSTSLADDPDGDLVIDEGEAPEPDTRIDVNFWENLTNADLDTQADSDTNADFSDDDNNTDLADKIDKIIKEQIHQDPVPVPSLKPKGSSDAHEKAPEETPPSKPATDNASALSRRDSIDDRTGLPNNLIQRLRDPRIRSRLLSQLEEVETNDKAPHSSLACLQNSLPVSNVNSSTVGDLQGGKIVNIDPRSQADGVTVHAGSYLSVSTAESSLISTQVPVVSQVFSHPAVGAHLDTVNSAMPGKPTPMVAPNTSAPNKTQVSSGIPAQLLVTQETPIQPLEISDKPEEPPDPSKVDFLVPPSDDEEDEQESIKRRPKKAKKQVDVELMYKSPLEDLQSEARPAYGKMAPRRYADNFPRRKSGDDRQARWDDRRCRDDRRASRDRSRDRRFEDRGRSHSKDRRFDDRGRSPSRDRRFDDRGRSRSRDRRFDDRGRDRSRSRDQRAYYDHPPRDLSRDRRRYDPYPGREDPDTTPHCVEMHVPYNQSPWPASPAFIHHQAVMMHPFESPHWQQNYYPEPSAPPHPPIFVPEPPKIDYMETRLINLELLPKTTNLEVPPVKKVFSYFDKESSQVFNTPPPTYDPNDQPRTIKMMDPVSEEMIDFIQTPRPTSGLTKDVFNSVPPDLSLDDIVKYHFLTPSYVMVQDNEEDPLSSSDEEEDKLEAKQKMLLLHRKRDSKAILEHRKRVSRPALDQDQKRESKPLLEHHSKKEGESTPGDNLKERSRVPEVKLGDDPLQNILQSLPLLREQYSMQKSQPPLIPPPPPPPEWNDVDLRMSREMATRNEEPSFPGPDTSPPKVRSETRARSRSVSPYRSRRSRSPRRRRRSWSRSPSPRSDMSISPSRSRSPSYSRRGTPRRRRSRSRSSERSRSSRSRRSCSPNRHSTSVSPSRKHSKW